MCVCVSERTERRDAETSVFFVSFVGPAPGRYVENKAGLTGQTVPGRRIPGHWPYPGPEELAEAELVGPDAWTFLSFNYHPASALAA